MAMSAEAKDLAFTGKETLRETFKNVNIYEILKNHHESLMQNVSENEVLSSFHGELSSTDAAQLLKDSEEGTFMLRTSHRFPAYIILSIKNGIDIKHYPIQSHLNGTFNFKDTFFCDAEDLVAFLRKNSSTHFNVTLKSTLKGSILPEHMWKKGYTTMLHKVVTEGNTALHMASYIGRDDMVQLLLSQKASTKILNLHGWTPLQMAVLGNNPSTISILIDEGKAEIEGRNCMNNFTPLHCAAACNNVESLKTLLELGANRLSLNDEEKTALQLAHQHKSHDCINELISQSSSKPVASTKLSDWYHGELSEAEQLKIESRYHNVNGAFYVRKSTSNVNYYVACLCWDGKWKYSRIFARDDGLVQYHSDHAYDSLEHAVGAFLEKFSSTIHPISPSDLISIDAGNAKLHHHHHKPALAASRTKLTSSTGSSSFQSSSPNRLNSLGLIKNTRFSKPVSSSPQSNGDRETKKVKKPTQQSLEERSQKRMLQVPALKNITQHSGVKGISTSTTDIQHHHHHHQHPPFSRSGNSTTAGATSFGNFFGVQNRLREKRQIFDTLNLKSLINKGLTSLRSKASMIPRIDSQQIQFGHQLGQGNFGKVYSGYFTDETFMTYPVAIKVLKDSMDGAQKKEFIQEASVMRQLLHPFIVRLYGIVTDNKNLWMELLPLGSLFERLTTTGARTSRLRTWILQICAGMKFMEASHYVHRDLAARNILLASQDQVKISDFGLSRYTGNSASYEYVQQSDSPIPFQWYAPEAFANYHFTSKSDVWSFGIVIWEMYNNCKFPYGNVSQDPVQLLHYLKQGGRLEKPPSCPTSTWAIVLGCWRMTPNHRPNFENLLRQFSSLPEYRSATNSLNKMLKWLH